MPAQDAEEFYAPVSALSPWEFDSYEDAYAAGAEAGELAGRQFAREERAAGVELDAVHYHDPDRDAVKDGFDDGWTSGYHLERNGK